MEVILHQFGHVLGLVHEHHKAGPIPLENDKEAIIRDHLAELRKEYRGIRNPLNQENMQ